MDAVDHERMDRGGRRSGERWAALRARQRGSNSHSAQLGVRIRARPAERRRLGRARASGIGPNLVTPSIGDCGLGVLVLGCDWRGANILWLWPVQFALDWTQFAS